MHIVRKETEEEMARAAVDIYATDCLRVCSEGREFTVAFSGGRTPLRFFSLLAVEPRVLSGMWRKTHVFWVDERCVSASDSASNYGNAKRALLGRVPLASNHIHPMPAELPPEEGARRYEMELIRCFALKPGAIPRFDLVVLGLGIDGHTASLFPGSDRLGENRRLVVPVKGGRPDVWRLSLTFPVLNGASHVMMLAAGNEKAPVVRALLGLSEWEPPARRIRPQRGVLTLLIDGAAAGDSDVGGPVYCGPEENCIED
jgi:6-phosphogluconolactonase